MKKLLLALLVFACGAIAFAKLRQTAGREVAARAQGNFEWTAVAQSLTELNVVATALRDEIRDKKNRLPQIHPGESVASKLLNRLAVQKLNPGEWGELRRELGVGWGSSDEYVLVSKRVLKQLNFPRTRDLAATRTACAVLAIAPDEESQINTAGQRLRELILSRVQRTEPADDIVAKYTIPA